jgi:hypothetical protein
MNAEFVDQLASEAVLTRQKQGNLSVGLLLAVKLEQLRDRRLLVRIGYMAVALQALEIFMTRNSRDGKDIRARSSETRQRRMTEVVKSQVFDLQLAA